MSFQHSLVVLRRDLRLQDNLALQAAIQQSQHVSVVFVLDKRQIKEHPYRSDRGLAFMINVLAAASIIVTNRILSFIIIIPPFVLLWCELDAFVSSSALTKVNTKTDAAYDLAVELAVKVVRSFLNLMFSVIIMPCQT